MSKEKPKIIKDFIGKDTPPREDAVSLINEMNKAKVKAVGMSYNGSGDSGDYETVRLATWNKKDGCYEQTDKPASTEISNLVTEIIDKLVQPNFNNDGCTGQMFFYINEEGKLKIEGTHSDYVTTTEDTGWEEVLVDPDDFL